MTADTLTKGLGAQRVASFPLVQTVHLGVAGFVCIHAAGLHPYLLYQIADTMQVVLRSERHHSVQKPSLRWWIGVSAIIKIRKSAMQWDKQVKQQ